MQFLLKRAAIDVQFDRVRKQHTDVCSPRIAAQPGQFSHAIFAQNLFDCGGKIVQRVIFPRHGRRMPRVKQSDGVRPLLQPTTALPPPPPPTRSGTHTTMN